MAENDGMRRYVEAATALTQITRARAEELVRELIKAGELERHRAQDWVEDLVKTSRERSEALVSTVRGEVRQQLKDLGFTNMDDLAKQVGRRPGAFICAAGRKATHRDNGKSDQARPQEDGVEAPAKARATTKKAGATKKASTKKASTGKKAPAAKKAAKKAHRLTHGRFAGGGSTPSSCGGGWRRHASAPATSWHGAPSSWAVPWPTSRPAWWPSPSPSSSSTPPPGASCRVAATSSTPPWSGSPSTCAGRRCLDAGASTGGFTDCLLQRGAASVAGRRRRPRAARPVACADRRVEVRERTNIRALDRTDWTGPSPATPSTWSWPICRSSRW